MDEILEVLGLSYKEFNNLNISFLDKTFYSIIGPNNCGKTTLFKLLSGLIPSNNVICCNDIYLSNDHIFDYIINIGVVERLNNSSFIYNLVSDEMMYPLKNLGYSKRNSLIRIKEILSLFNKEEIFNKKINELDYYDKTLLLLMISLLHKPKVLLLDNVLEVFSNQQIQKIIRVLKKLNITIIYFTNSLKVAYYSDKLILLDNYKIIGKYHPSDIYQNDKLFYEHNLEIPFLIDLSIKLKMYNIIDKEYISMKAMVDDIWP